ncbi:MAG: hypothetical protein ACOX02_04325 [Acholeplasmatales bacterium]
MSKKNNKKKRGSKIPQSKTVVQRFYIPLKHPHFVLAERDDKYASVGLTTSPSNRSNYIALNKRFAKSNKVSYVQKTIKIDSKARYSKTRKRVTFNDNNDVKTLLILENKAKKKLLSSK